MLWWVYGSGGGEAGTVGRFVRKCAPLPRQCTHSFPLGPSSCCPQFVLLTSCVFFISSTWVYVEPPGPHFCALVLCKQMFIVSGLQRGSCKLAGKTSASILMELSQCKPLGLDMLMQANSPCSDSDRLKSDHVTTTKYTLPAASKQAEMQLNGSTGEVESRCFIKGEE